MSHMLQNSVIVYEKKIDSNQTGTKLGIRQSLNASYQTHISIIRGNDEHDFVFLCDICNILSFGQLKCRYLKKESSLTRINFICSAVHFLINFCMFGSFFTDCNKHHRLGTYNRQRDLTYASEINNYCHGKKINITRRSSQRPMYYKSADGRWEGKIYVTGALYYEAFKIVQQFVIYFHYMVPLYLIFY